MRPTLGRIVHYTAPTECGGETYAGIIVKVYEDKTAIDIVTLGSSSVYHNNGVEFAEVATPGRWTWPPRV
jgi:hypothetical protein